MNVDYSLIGTRIKHARKSCNMTQEHLAEKLGVSIGYVSQVERGITKISLDLLASISNILNRDLCYFVSGANYMAANYMEEELIREFSKLSTGNKQLVIQIIGLFRKNERGE